MKIKPAYSVLTLLVGLVYLNTLQVTFHFDDIPSILEKPWIRGLDKIPNFIFSIWQRPLVILTFNLNYAISQFEVWSYHIFNILFHLCVVFLIYRLAYLALEKMEGDTQAYRALPFLSAVLFALHPLNTQTVVYISSRSSALATLFYLATILVLFAPSQNDALELPIWKRPGRIIAAGVLFSCAFLSKQIALTLPAALFIFDYYFISRQSFGDWLRQRKLWLGGAVGLLGAGITYKAIWGGGWVSATKNTTSSLEYFLTQLSVIPLEYVRKMILPFNLVLDTYYPPPGNGWNLRTLLGIAVLTALLGGLIVATRKILRGGNFYRWVGFSIAWVLITLSPTSSFIPLLDVMAEHRTYLPMVGYCIFASALLCRLKEYLQPSPIVLASTLCLVLLFFSTLTIERNRVWKNQITLWTDVKEKSPLLLRAFNNLGTAYDNAGLYDQAVEELQTVLQMNPDYVQALSNLGNIYGKRGEIHRSIPYFKKVLKLDPHYAPGYYNLGKALQLTGRGEEAAKQYQNAIRENPYFEEAYFNLGFLALQLGQPERAIQNLNKFIEMQPNNAKAYFGLGNAYILKNDIENGLSAYKKSSELDPDYLSPNINAGSIQIQKGKIDDALETFQNLAKRYPRIAGVHKNLGVIYYQHKNDPAKAAHHLAEYLKLEPNAEDAELVRNTLKEIENKN